MSIIASYLEVKFFPIRFVHTYIYLWRFNHMSDKYTIAFPITTAGYTGSISGFISTAGTTHNVEFIPARGSTARVTISAQPGVVYPIVCSTIKPSTSTILGLN